MSEEIIGIITGIISGLSLMIAKAIWIYKKCKEEDKKAHKEKEYKKPTHK